MVDTIKGLTPSQEVAYHKIKKFLSGPDQFFLLTGKPGVGKTYILKRVLADLINEDYANLERGHTQIMNVAGITLAHKAKNVLRDSIPNVFTFAKAFNKREVIHDDGSRTFERAKKTRENQFIAGEAGLPVYVYDECSMFNQDMINIIMSTLATFSKVIFVGDKAQLPPIFSKEEVALRGEDKDSPIFDLDWREENSHELTERVRQAAGNPILELSDIIREEIFGNQDIIRVLEAMKQPKIIDGQGFTFVKKQDLVKDFVSNNNIVNSKIISFRKSAIDEHNIKVRENIFPEAKAYVLTGDSVFINVNYHPEIKFSELNISAPAKVHNSDELEVKTVYKTIATFNIHDMGKVNIECYVISFHEQPGVVLAPTEESMDDFNKAYKKLYDNAKKSNTWFVWKKYYDFSKNFCQFSYGYAITSHKSQGSTYENVYVDVNDILTVSKISPKRKLQSIYTAMTRASKLVKFIKKNAS